MRLWNLLLIVVCMHLGLKLFAAEDPYAKHRWIQRVAASLHYPLARDEINALLPLEPAAIIHQFMEDRRFGDAALGAFMHFYGRSVEPLKAIDSKGQVQYHPMAQALPQAMAAARSAQLGEDFDLFSPRPPLLVRPMAQQRSAEESARILQTIQSAFDQAASRFRGPDQSWDKQAGCDGLEALTGIFAQGMGLTLAGFDPLLEEQVISQWLGELIISGWSRQVAPDCARENVSAEMIVGKIVAIRQAIENFWTQIPQLAAAGESRGDLLDLRPVTAPAQLPPLAEPLSNVAFWNVLPNSSSNFNRKRAAYMLRTYFCDELGAISVEAGHSEEVHGGNPACQSCHYKLDPLAGLFRHYGQLGTDYSGSQGLIFDDSGEVYDSEWDRYLKSWQNADGSWRVGYYIEPGRPHPAWNGHQLDDFLRFAGQSKDVKACFVRRMAEYFVGENRSFDGSWLAQLSTTYSQAPSRGLGFKEMVRDLLLSRAYSVPDPEAGVCYDLPAGSSERPPCRVASLLEENCNACHNAGFASGGLDLSRWIKSGDGLSAFPHRRQGQELSRDESFDTIRSRITSGERGPQMPLGRVMSPTDRQRLYEWLGEQQNP